MIGNILDALRGDFFKSQDSYSNELPLWLKFLDEQPAVESEKDLRDLRCLQFLGNARKNLPICIKIDDLYKRVFNNNEPVGFHEFATSIQERLFIPTGQLLTNEEIICFLDSIKSIYPEHAEKFQEYLDRVEEDKPAITFQDFFEGHIKVLGKMCNHELDLFLNRFQELSPQFLPFINDLEEELHETFFRDFENQDTVVKNILEEKTSPEMILKALCLFESRNAYYSQFPELVPSDLGNEHLNKIKDKWDQLKEQFTATQLKGLVVVLYALKDNYNTRELLDLVKGALEEKQSYGELFWEVVDYYSPGILEEKLLHVDELFLTIGALSNLMEYQEMKDLVQPLAGPANAMTFLRLGRERLEEADKA